MSTLDTVLKTLGKDMVSDSPLTGGDSFASLGMDSLDLIEVILDLEEAFPDAHLENYEPSLGTTMQELADEIDRRLAA